MERCGKARVWTLLLVALLAGCGGAAERVGGDDQAAGGAAGVDAGVAASEQHGAIAPTSSGGPAAGAPSSATSAAPGGGGSPGASEGVASAGRPSADPPVNPHLAVSPYPMAHRNPYSQGSVPGRGPEPGDAIDVDVVSPAGLSVGRSAPLPLLSERYPGGERVVWGTTGNRVYKALLLPDGLEIVANYLIDATALFADQSMYNVMLKGNRVYVPDGATLKMFTDADPNDPRSPIVQKQNVDLPGGIGKAGAIGVTYDGRIAFGAVRRNGLTGDIFTVGVIDQGFRDLRTFELPPIEGEKARNNLGIDEEGGIYVVTSKRLVRVQWDGQALTLAWEAAYDMGEGGSGTTPSLMGVGNEDKLVLVTDGHAPNNVVAFWRGAIPADWKGLPDRDRRVAAVEPAPFSTEITNENSPVVRGYGVAFAQWNGIKPLSCTPKKGVQKYVWSPERRTLERAWANGEVTMNNVLMMSDGSQLLYGIGRDPDCRYYLALVDWGTGKLRKKFLLGTGDEFHNPGNAMPIDDDRRLLYTSLQGLVSIRPVADAGGGTTTSSTAAPPAGLRPIADRPGVDRPTRERPEREDGERRGDGGVLPERGATPAALPACPADPARQACQADARGNEPPRRGGRRS